MQGCSVLTSHQYWGGVLEAVQQIFLHQVESFAPGLPAQDALHSCWWTLLRPQPHPVIVRTQQLITGRTRRHVVWQDRESLLRGFWKEHRQNLSANILVRSCTLITQFPGNREGTWGWEWEFCWQFYIPLNYDIKQRDVGLRQAIKKINVVFQCHFNTCMQILSWYCAH